MKRLTILLIIILSPFRLSADDAVIINLEIKDHVFVPSEIKAPAGQKIKIKVTNLDNVMEEFESSDLHREKILRPGVTETIILAPLKPGKYSFIGEMHDKTAKGILIVE